MSRIYKPTIPEEKSSAPELYALKIELLNTLPNWLTKNHLLYNAAFDYAIFLYATGGMSSRIDKSMSDNFIRQVYGSSIKDIGRLSSLVSKFIPDIYNNIRYQNVDTSSDDSDIVMGFGWLIAIIIIGGVVAKKKSDK